MNDDAREVLALLNSLGFVGITAQQLKSFMKDLKLYRKIKDRERQQRKEEIKKKILDKQKNMIKEILREQRTELHSIENTVSTNSSSSYVDSSLLKVKVKCLSSDKENRNSINSEEVDYINTRHKLDAAQLKSKSKKTQDHCNIKLINRTSDNENQEFHLKNKSKHMEHLQKDFHLEKQCKQKSHDKILNQINSAPLESVRPMSAPNLLGHQQEHVVGSQTRSTSSTKNTHSGTKSFIRPWRLQPEVQKSLSIKKTDPVTLYQKYQQEWKQISFPGEAKHAGVRWAIREKMLGADPHPMPLPRKSTSMPMLKRK
ncbi:unnamed protein product [Xylocopa violacea]|uniref:Centriolar and ciliogenesis-associated protein HYLS1 C-terminal domain-containing protein n=1 Tax=Xylocopa violacea TaxID=135666 RepID=A0ABP1N2J6_XYLVO